MRNIHIVSVAIVLLLSCQSGPKKKPRPAITDNLGEIFKLDNIVDSSGRQVTLNFSSSDITIIDIWNTTCAPCIKEMKKFPGLVKDKESRFSIVSISLSQFWNWKPLLEKHTGAFAFLQYNLPNWKQYNLLTTDNPAFKNTISADRLSELGARYHVTGNPAYFVLDKIGKIIARPASAVKYLEDIQ